jgi:hypothetical protein
MELRSRSKLNFKVTSKIAVQSEVNVFKGMSSEIQNTWDTKIQINFWNLAFGSSEG